MKATYAVLVSATFALALLAPQLSEAASVSKPGSEGSQSRGGGGHASGNHGWGGRGAPHHGGRHWGGHRHHHRHHWRPWWGFYAAAPFVFGSAFYYSSWDPYWGYWGPRHYGYSYYPRYEEEYVVARPGEQDLGPPSEINPSAPGAPTQGPLYMNYCPSAKAYYPKVGSCPEGWELRRPNYRD